MDDFMAFLSGKFLQHALVKKAGVVWSGFTTMATDPKSQRLLKKIGTHSGTFHCDEALACFMLNQLPEYKDAEIVRTRDNQILETCDIVVDVGGKYDPKTYRFDHHQRDFEHTLSSVRPDLAKNKFIRLSSAGLVYAHFGLQVLEEIYKKENIFTTSDCLRHIFLFVYDGFVEEIDAIDNGVPMYGEAKPIYKISTDLSTRVDRLNPEWNNTNPKTVENQFQEAVKLVGLEFQERVFHAAKIWWPAREIVRESIERRQKYHDSGEIITLSEACPWKDHIYSLEEELGIEGVIKFCIFQGDDSWRVQGVPVQPDSFICRVFLHKDWRGLRDEKMSDTAGIDGCIFCHSTGFIGGNKTKEGALQMALNSLKASAVNRD